jgi:hypothetical protein
MPENAAVRRAPDEPWVIKAIMVIADSGPGLAASSDETRGDVRSATWPHA